jgi:hypothetical protein
MLDIDKIADSIRRQRQRIVLIGVGNVYIVAPRGKEQNYV